MYRAPGEVRLETPNMTVLTATLTCPHCGHEKTETMPTNACLTSTSARPVEPFFDRSLETAASSAPMGRADAHPGKTQAHDSVAHSRRRLASPSDRACRPPVRASGG